MVMVKRMDYRPHQQQFVQGGLFPLGGASNGGAV